MICYDREAFDEASVPYPEPGWTWDDFFAKARTLTVREGENVTRPGFALLSPDDQGPFIEGRVGPLIDDATDPPTPRFDRPEVIKAVRWYAELWQEQIVAYVQPTEETEGYSVLDSRTLYSGDLAAMWVDTSGNWQWSSERGRVGVVPFPVDTPDSRTTPVRAQTLVMSAGTRHPNAAWRWMNFLSQQAINALGAQYLPSRRSAAEITDFWDSLADEGLANALRYAVDHNYTIQRRGPGYAAFYQAMDAILKGEKSAEQALAEAQVQAMAEIEEALAQQAEATPVHPFVVAPPEEQKPTGEKAVTITFTTVLGSFGTQRYRDLARQFHETYPDVLVEVKATPFGDPHDLQGLANAADCFLGYPSFQAPENGAAILDLAPLLDANPSFTADDFYPPVLEPFTWRGQLWGLPAEVEPYVIEYNKDLFDDAGLDYPTSDWTTDEFLSLARALTRGEGEAKQYGFVPEAYEGYVLPLILERLGAELIDESTDPPTLHFDNLATVKALSWYADLATVHDVRPLFITDLAELAEGSPPEVEREEIIEEGRAAMWASSGVALAVARDRDGLNVGVVSFPLGPGGAGGYRSPKGYFISAQAESPQACWEWIIFLTEQVEAAEAFPARRSVAESEAYRQQVGEKRAAAYRASVAGLERPFQISSEAAWLRGATYLLFQAYGRVLEGEAGVETELNTAQGKAGEYRTCVIARDAFYHQEDWKACLKEVDPTLLDFLFGEEE